MALGFKKCRDRVYYGWVVVAAFCIAGTAIWGIRFDLKQSDTLSFLLGVAVMLVTATLITFVRRETGRTGLTP